MGQLVFYFLECLVSILFCLKHLKKDLKLLVDWKKLWCQI